MKDATVRLAKSTKVVFDRKYDWDKSVVDRFVQKLTMPYGSVWREAVLLDYDLSGVDSMQFQDSATAERVAAAPSTVSTHSAIVSAHGESHPVTVPGRSPCRLSNPDSMVAGLMILTIVIGWVSNWLTQGYYRKPVWTVTNTISSLGFVFLILIVLLSFA